MVRHHRGERVSYLDLAAAPSAPFWARRHTDTALRSWHVMQEAIETATLLVSELMTNAIQASDYESRQRTCPEADEAQPISLTLRLLPARLVIEVFDNNPDPPILSEAAADAESGRVLAILQVLSKEWGHYGLPSGGKIVFCVLSPPDAAASDIQHNMLTPDSGTAPHR